MFTVCGARVAAPIIIDRLTLVNVPEPSFVVLYLEKWSCTWKKYKTTRKSGLVLGIVAKYAYLWPGSSAPHQSC
jgi:hypothetical protein